MLTTRPSKILTLVCLLATTGFASLALAQGGPVVIVYGPPSTAVPTLGGGALIALAVLLAVVAVRILKDQQHSRANLVALLTATAALAIGFGGVTIVGDAMAGEAPIEMTEENGGAIDVPEGFSIVVNATNTTQTITSINVVDMACSIGEPDDDNGGAPMPAVSASNGGARFIACSVGTSLEPEAVCEIFVTCMDTEPT